MRFCDFISVHLNAVERVYKLKAISLQVHPIQNEFITFAPVSLSPLPTELTLFASHDFIAMASIFNTETGN